MGIPSYSASIANSPILTVENILQLTTAVAVHLSLTPPNPPVKNEECCSGTEGTETLFERLVQSVTYLSKFMCWFGVLCNTLHLAVHGLLAEVVGASETVSVETSTAATNRHIHLAVIIGTIATIAGATLRTWCFRTLGPMFTFEITIRPKHELISHGPYAWVRHPSYTGVFLILGGATLVLGAPQTWISEYFVRTPFGICVAVLWVLKCTFAFRGMCVRLRAEDEVLKKTFGAEWEKYASRVPFKFIPGII